MHQIHAVLYEDLIQVVIKAIVSSRVTYEIATGVRLCFSYEFLTMILDI